MADGKGVLVDIIVAVTDGINVRVEKVVFVAAIVILDRGVTVPTGKVGRGCVGKNSVDGKSVGELVG